MKTEIHTILKLASDQVLADILIETFTEVERNYLLKSWKTSELDAGHFVEAARRFIEFQLIGKYPAVGKPLQAFNEKTMQSYMQAKGDEAYRIHIPRVLLLVYGIRNKRGVGHITELSPTHYDATLIVSCVKWVLSEFVRINSNYDLVLTRTMVDQLSERYIEGIWEDGDKKRILVDGLNLREQILFLLLSEAKISEQKLAEYIEPKDKAYFRRTLRSLHKSRHIELSSDGKCTISPKGIAAAEAITLNHD